MWSDNETLEDFLCCQHLIAAVESLVTNDQLLPCSVGVFGDWGSGKTSLLKMVEKQLASRSDIIVIWFNGWLFEGIEDAKTALMGTILEKLVEKKSIGKKSLSLFCKLWKGLDKMRVSMLAGKVGLAASGLHLSMQGHTGHEVATGSSGISALGDLTEISKQLKEACGERVKIEDIEKCFADAKDAGARKAIREFRNDFEELLETTDIKSVVVFIDDLDRCMPETIVETLEAIKLFLFARKTAFVIGADERLVKYAVRNRFPELPGEKAEVGRDYLEKLIQFPVRVPSLGVAEFETYINLLFGKLGWITKEQFAKLHEAAIAIEGQDVLSVRLNLSSAKKALNNNVPEKLEENFILASQLAPILAAGLAGNPRQCKRFLNMLLMRLNMAETRSIKLNQRVLAKLMLLEYFRPESFRQLAHFQAQESGKPIALAKAERAAALNKKASSQTREDLTDEGTEKTSSEETPRIAPWLNDDWIKKWLNMEPHLAAEDLRPYFFFSRDTLGSLSAVAQRLTPLAQEVLAGLLHDSEAVVKNTLQKVSGLNDAEAAGIFEALCERVRQEDDLGDEKSCFARLLQFVKERINLFSQYLALLTDLPESTLPPHVVTTLISLCDDLSKQAAAKALLNKWTQSSNNDLKKLAKSRVGKLNW